MPATTETYRDMKRLHRIFAASGSLLLVATIWMLAKDHHREWKVVQRKAASLELKLNDWKQTQFRAQTNDESLAEWKKLQDTAEGTRSTLVSWYGWLPLPGKRLLELPFFDMFNSPRKIETLWGEGLQIDYNLVKVQRYDRCTTCHQFADVASLGRSVPPGYPPLLQLEFALDRLPDAADSTATGGSKSADEQLDRIWGIRLASEGLWQPGDVCVQFVWKNSPAARARPESSSNDPHIAGQDLRRSLLQSNAAETLQVNPPRGLMMGDVIDRVQGRPVRNRAEAQQALLDASRSNGPVVLSVRRGLPSPYASHPRLDLFVGESSPHPMSSFGCTVCHEGQGSATQFSWVSHGPNDPAQREQWMERHGWFDNPDWRFPMYPKRFTESGCLKCHPGVTELTVADRTGQPPAPKLARGYQLIRTYGCFGCHEFNGMRDGLLVAPDLRVEPAGTLRKVGPSLRSLKEKLAPAFVYEWIRRPREIRSTTRMPQPFELWDHLSGQGRGVSTESEPLEILGIVTYLMERSQPFRPVVLPTGIAESSREEKIARGKVLFQERGCLACHSHGDFPDAEACRNSREPLLGPDLTGLAGPLGHDAGRQWLYHWIKQPTRYHARTRMPETSLEPIPLSDGRRSDPAADIVEYLLAPSPSDWKPSSETLAVIRGLDAAQLAALDRVAIEYLRDSRTESAARDVLTRGLRDSAAEAESTAESELTQPPSTLQKLLYVGRRSLNRYGCFACHDVPGLEDAKPIGPAMADWGRKDEQQLAFESVLPYLQQTQPSEVDLPGFYEQQIRAGHRAGFAYQKLREPRSYDFRRTESKRYTERLKMPQFALGVDDREAIITFLLGLVADPPGGRYSYRPNAARAAELAGHEVLDSYRCKSCHMIRPEVWRVAFEPGRFALPAELTTFPFLRTQLASQAMEGSKAIDAGGLIEAELHAMPTLAEDGLPRVMDEEGLPLEDAADYSPRSVEYTIDLWKPAVIEGRIHEVGVQPLSVPASMLAERQEADGGFLVRYLLPHVVRREREASSAAKGNEAWGWLPPPLHHEGQKVQTDWLHNYLLNPQPIRPAVILRMPRYNLSSLESTALAQYFAVRDGSEYPYEFRNRRQPDYLAELEQQYQQKLPAVGATAAARSRLGDAMRIVTDSNFCVKCHRVGDFEPQVAIRSKAPDLTQAYQRLRPGYVRDWIANPPSLLPYTGMPVNIPFRPDQPGQGAISQDLCQGTSIEQIDAMVDLLMNYDEFARQHALVSPTVKLPAAIDVKNQQK